MQQKTVHVHVSRLCNLSCTHCYSSSGPTQRETLPLAQLARFLSDARDEGYQTVAFSGGEPMLYPELADALEIARALGLDRIGVTNGTVFHPRQEKLMHSFDFLAVSVDGPEYLHNAIRGSPTAFARTLKGLALLRSSGIRFGVAHTVTRDSLPHLGWMAAFALESGARVLQLHPLSGVGAAAEAFAELDGEICARTYLAAQALALDAPEGFGIHVDLFNREALRQTPSLVVPPEPDADRHTPLSDLLNPLVLMANGDVSPICHGMGRRYRLGNLADAPLAELARAFLRDGSVRFRSFCETLLDEVLRDQGGWPYLNWYELLEQRSLVEEPSAIAAA